MSHPLDLVAHRAEDLDERERALVAEHLARCPACVEQLREFELAEELLSIRESPVLLGNRSIRPISWWHRFGGAVAILPLVAGGLFVAVGLGALLGSAPARTDLGPAGPARQNVVTRLIAMPSSRAVGIEIGRFVQDFEWIDDRGVAHRLGDPPGTELVLVLWDSECAPCSDELSTIQAELAGQRWQAAILAVTLGGNPSQLGKIRAEHSGVDVIADPQRILAAPYQAGGSRSASTYVLSRDARLTRLITGEPPPFSLQSALGLARSLTDPEPLGTLVDVPDRTTLRVLLESPMMSAQFGRPAVFRANELTVYVRGGHGLADLHLSPGDRVRIAFYQAVVDPSDGAFILLSVARE